MLKRGLRGSQLGFVILVLMVGAGRLGAQVGYPPNKSPYHDIRKGHTFTALYGQFGGSGGEFGIGPHDGPTYAFRYDIRTGSPVQIGLGFAHGSLERLIVDPFVAIANRVSGPVDQSVNFAELNLQLNLTGGKSWHRIAPFLGLGTGLGISSSTPADTSRFDFGNKFYFVPSGGFRLFLSQRLHLRAEGRATFWKITYPTTFRIEQSGTTFTEWSTSWWVMGGLGYSISP